MSHKLFVHQPHEHRPQNVNEAAQAERLSLNDQIAVFISARVGSMICAYVFAGIGIGSLVGVFTNNVLLSLICGSLSSYFIQLVLLPIIMVGQNIQSRHAELEADETFNNTQALLHEFEQLEAHQQAQDTLAQQQTQRLEEIATSLAQQQEVLFLLLEHLGIEAKFTTNHTLPIVRVGGHRVSIDEDKLRTGLILAGHKPDVVGMLDLPELLTLDKKRPRHHEHEEEAHDADL